MAQGAPVSLWETTTFSTLSPRTFLRLLARPPYSFPSARLGQYVRGPYYKSFADGLVGGSIGNGRLSA